MLRLRLVGEIAAEVDGESRPLPPGRPRALLAWLALRPGLQPRAAVASAFWPDVLDDSARASLRSALWALRALLGEEALVAARDRVGLPPDTWVDVLEAERLSAAGDLEEALELCDGPFLPGIDDEWALEAQDEHRERVVRLLEAVAAAAGRDGDLRRAVVLTRRQAALEPLSEEIHRSLMRRLDAVGDRGAALAEYTELRTASSPVSAPARRGRRSSSPTRCAKASPRPRRPRFQSVSSEPTGPRSSAARRELARIDAAWRRVVARAAVPHRSSCSQERRESASHGSSRASRPRRAPPARPSSTAPVRSSRSSRMRPSRRRSAARRPSGRRSRRS